MYDEVGIEYRFLLGRPTDTPRELTSHNQGGVDTEKELHDGRWLFYEAREFGDILVIPYRDAYMSLANKLLQGLEWAYTHFPDVPYIGIQDDEYCFYPKRTSKYGLRHITQQITALGAYRAVDRHGRAIWSPIRW